MKRGVQFLRQEANFAIKQLESNRASIRDWEKRLSEEKKRWEEEHRVEAQAQLAQIDILKRSDAEWSRRLPELEKEDLKLRQENVDMRRENIELSDANIELRHQTAKVPMAETPADSIELERLRNMVVELEEKVIDLEDIRLLDSETIKEYEVHFADLSRKTKLQRLSATVDELSQRIQGRDVKIEELSSQLKGREETIADLRTQIDDIRRGDDDGMNNHSSELRTTIGGLQERIRRREATI